MLLKAKVHSAREIVTFRMWSLFQTRIFVTNSLSFLPQCDQIIMVDNGTVSETGNYEEMKNEDGPFADFIKLFLMNNETNKEQISSYSLSA